MVSSFSKEGLGRAQHKLNLATSILFVRFPSVRGTASLCQLSYCLTFRAIGVCALPYPSSLTSTCNYFRGRCLLFLYSTWPDYLKSIPCVAAPSGLDLRFNTFAAVYDCQDTWTTAYSGMMACQTYVYNSQMTSSLLPDPCLYPCSSDHLTLLEVYH